MLVNIITATLFAESDVSFVSGCQYMYIKKKKKKKKK